MKEGGTWELYIPSELAYGDRGAGARIPGGSVLVRNLYRSCFKERWIMMYLNVHVSLTVPPITAAILL